MMTQPGGATRPRRPLLIVTLAVLVFAALACGVALELRERGRPAPPLHSWALGGAIAAVAFSPDGALLAAGDHIGAIALWRVDDRAPVRTMAAGGPVTAIAFAPDGRTLIAVTGDRIARWGLADGAPIGQPIATAGAAATALAISPDGATIAAGVGAAVRLYRLADGAAVGTLPGEPAPILGSNAIVRLAFAPDGATLLAATADDLVRRFALPGGSLDLEREGHTHLQVASPYVRAAVLAPDGRTVASTEGQGAINVLAANVAANP